MASEKMTLAPSGVRGWLLFLCIVLTFIVPLEIVYQMIAALRLKLGVVGFIYVLVYLGLAMFSLISGVLLWRIRPNAVTTAKIFLLAQAAFAVALYAKVVMEGWAFISPDSAQDLLPATIIRTIVFTLVWYAYLTKSRRVQATYPQDYSVVTKKL